MDFSKFKKVHSTKTHTIFQHPDGHIIQLSNDSMDSEKRSDVKALPFAKMNAGGMAGLYSPEPPRLEPTSVRPMTLEQMAQPPIELGAPPPMSGDAELDLLKSGLGQQERALREQAEVGAMQAQGEERVAREREQAAQQLQRQQQDILKSLMSQHEEFKKAALDNTISPDRYLENMSTPGKIATIAGLIAGGLGAAGTDGKNLAAEALNKQIERDIDAQKANIDQKNNLLKFNLEVTKNMQDAITLTRLQLEDIYSSKLQQVAAQSKGPMARAKVEEAIGQLKQTKAEQLGGVMQRLAMRQGLQSGAVQPEQAIDIVVPEGSRKEAREHLSAIRAVDDGLNMLNQKFADAKELGTAEILLDPRGTGRSKLDLINASIEAAVRSAHKGQGAFTDQDAAALITPYQIKATDTKQQIEIKRRGLQESLAKQRIKAESALTALKVPVPPAPAAGGLKKK